MRTSSAPRLSDARPIPPGGSLYFEMGIHVPASAPLGKNGLFWQLDPTGAQFPETVSASQCPAEGSSGCWLPVGR